MDIIQCHHFMTKEKGFFFFQKTFRETSEGLFQLTSQNSFRQTKIQFCHTLATDN